MQNPIIKDYQVKSELGQGGMATVYLAHDIKFQTNVAIKVLNKEFVNNENIRKRFIAETRNMFKMSHPNIIKVTDLIDEGDTVAFVMEYIEGETLKEYLERKGKLSDEEIKNLFSQMLDAVGYVHEQNLVHRDIKPSNFMITPKGQIKLLDFGIAKNTDTQSADYTQTGTSQNMGTPMFMSPEQIKSTKDVTLQSDIYSLGVVLWQMVSGKRPYTATLSNYQLQTKIVNERLSKTWSIFDSIIEKATEKETSKRYQSISEISNSMKTDKQVVTSKESEKTQINLGDNTVFEKKENHFQNLIKDEIEKKPILEKKQEKSVPIAAKKKNTILIISRIAVVLLIVFLLKTQPWVSVEQQEQQGSTIKSQIEEFQLVSIYGKFPPHGASFEFDEAKDLWCERPMAADINAYNAHQENSNVIADDLSIYFDKETTRRLNSCRILITTKENSVEYSLFYDGNKIFASSFDKPTNNDNTKEIKLGNLNNFELYVNDGSMDFSYGENYSLIIEKDPIIRFANSVGEYELSFKRVETN
jgi:serine/threonine protein kinase